MKLEIKEVYIVDGKEYNSIQEARSAKNFFVTQNIEESPQKVINFSKIKIYDVDVLNLKFHDQIFESIDLLNIVNLRQQLSNENYRYVLPTYSEIVQMKKLNIFPNSIPDGEYWTSTRFLYNTYISYDNKNNRYNDIYPQYKRNAFFLIKENKPETWFRDPAIPNSIDEIIFLQEKERNNIVHSY